MALQFQPDYIWQQLPDDISRAPFRGFEDEADLGNAPAPAQTGTLADFTTAIDPAQERAYQQWKARLPRNLQNESDYDLRGAFKANAKAAANGHMGDQFKKPNHMTFSDESQYSTSQQPGGHWGDAGNDKYTYWASPTNLKYHSLSDLAQYFKQVEPGNTLIAPFNYRLPPQ